jgi:F-type H+-transporting ATPase subunit epsilon
MKCEIVTLNGTAFSGDITEASLKTVEGEIGILSHHEPLTAVLVPGAIHIKRANGESESYAVFSGILDVGPDLVRILTDEAEHGDELIQADIEAALAEAERLKDKATTHHEIHHAQTLIDRHQVRLGVAKMRRRHRRSRGDQSN